MVDYVRETGCVDGTVGVFCSATLSASHVTAALVVESVGGARSVGAGFSGALGTGLLAVWPSGHQGGDDADGSHGEDNVVDELGALT